MLLWGCCLPRSPGALSDGPRPSERPLQVLNLLSGVPIDASSSFLLGLVVGAAGSIKRLVSRWRGRRNDGNNGGTAPAGA